MKQSGKSNLFALVCIAVLLGAYGVGLGVKKVRFAGIGEQAWATAGPEKSADKLESDDEKVAAEKGDSSEEVAAEPSEEPVEEVAARPERPEGRRRGGMMGEGMRERFQNMSEEERQEAMAQMRERFGGRSRGGGEGRGGGAFSQMSEEDRENFRADMEKLGASAEEMSEEERRQARTEIFEKYGITPREGGGGRPGGGRRPGGRE